MTKLKLDLHTHCGEATNSRSPTIEIVGEIVSKIKARGLDGIAISEHYDKDWGYKAKEIVERHFNNEVLIIPGKEIGVGMREEVAELYLPNGATFRFWVHPYNLNQPLEMFGDIQGIEIHNGMHEWQLNTEKAEEFAQRHNLLTLQNSDAHYLSSIGEFYNEITLEELYARAKVVTSEEK